MVGVECSLPFVTFLHADVVVALPEVKLGEETSILQLVDEFLDQGKWVMVYDRK